MNHFFYNDNQDLACEGIAVGDLVVEHGTPLYVYSSRQIVDRCTQLRSALDGWMRDTRDPRAVSDDDPWDRYPYVGN